MPVVFLSCINYNIVLLKIILKLKEINLTNIKKQENFKINILLKT